MRMPIIIIASLAALCGPAIAEDAPSDNLLSAAYVEWFSAHCDAGKLNPLYVMMAANTANGADAGTMAQARQQVRATILQHVGTDVPAACGALEKTYGAKAD